MLKQTLVTHQTGPEGKVVRKLMVAEAVEIEKEYYLAILMDREGCCPVVVASTEGGVDIEAVAAETPEKILRERIHPARRSPALRDPEARRQPRLRRGPGESVRKTPQGALPPLFGMRLLAGRKSTRW